MVAISENEPVDGRKTAEEKFRRIWRSFYSHEIDEATRKRQLDETINSLPPDVQNWLCEIVDSRDRHKPITRVMRWATEELSRATQPQSKGERKFVRNEKAKIRRE